MLHSTITSSERKEVNASSQDLPEKDIIRELEEAAKAGSQLAHAKLLYLEGNRLKAAGRPIDAFKLLQQAARLNHLQAQCETAEMLLNANSGIEPDSAEALTLFRQAAEHKESTPHIKYRLGCVLLDPSIVDNNPPEGLKWLLEAAKNHHFESCLALGHIYLEGRAGTDTSSLSAEDKETQTADRLRTACHWLNQALCIADKSASQTFAKETYFRVYLYLATAHDRLKEHTIATEILERAALKGHSWAQLQLAIRCQLGKDMPADSKKAMECLKQAATAKCRPVDNDPAVLVANALLSCDFTSIPHQKLATLVQNGIEFKDPSYGSNIYSDQLTIDCLPIGSGSIERINLVDANAKGQEDVTKIITECLDPSNTEDPTTQPLGVALYVDILDSTGLRKSINLAIVKPGNQVTQEPAPAETKEPSAESQRVVIMRSGHHTNNWLAVMGDIDKIMPTLLKYLNRDWKRDIAERNSGLEWLPQRLHLSLGKPAFGDVYVGKIGIGCITWMYVILSTPPPTLRPEIHTVFPVIVAKARKYFLRVKQILEWHNRIEATMMSEIDYTTDPESISMPSKSAAAAVADKTIPADEPQSIMPITPRASDQKVTLAPTKTFPLFAIDFVSRRNIWEGKGILEVFMAGIASLMVRNPQESTQIKVRRRPSQDMLWSQDPVQSLGGTNYQDDDDERKVNTTPASVVPDIAGAHGKTFPWSQIKDIRGIIPNEGPRRENRVCYVQGRCVRTIKLPGTIWGKSAYLVTIRINEERNHDLDVWCLLKHMVDGRATIVPGEYMTVNAGSIPIPGDLVYADVWIHGTIATGLDPVPTTGELVTASRTIEHEDDRDVLAPAPQVAPAPAPPAAAAPPVTPAANASGISGAGTSSVSGTMFAATARAAQRRSSSPAPDAEMKQESVAPASAASPTARPLTALASMSIGNTSGRSTTPPPALPAPAVAPSLVQAKPAA